MIIKKNIFEIGIIYLYGVYNNFIYYNCLITLKVIFKV